MKTLAIIQARMGSTRLPGKVLFDLADKTVLEHIIFRVASSHLVDQVVVATTTNTEDQAIVDLCNRLKVSVVCGSCDDVLDRFFQVITTFNPQHVVRITGDCPIIDPKVVDMMIERHFVANADYTSNGIEETFPDGEDVEVIRSEALKIAHSEANLASDREHVTLYIRNHPERFKLESVRYQRDLSKKRWTLDNQEDYLFIKAIYDQLYSKDKLFGMDQVLQYLNDHPELENINAHINRNEGLAKSLKNDCIITNKKEANGHKK